MSAGQEERTRGLGRCECRPCACLRAAVMSSLSLRLARFPPGQSLPVRRSQETRHSAENWFNETSLCRGSPTGCAAFQCPCRSDQVLLGRRPDCNERLTARTALVVSANHLNQQACERQFARTRRNATEDGKPRMGQCSFMIGCSKCARSPCDNSRGAA